MSIEETRALWERFKAADQARDSGALAQLYAEDVVFPGTGLKGRAALTQFDSSVLAAFPDYKREFLTELVGEDTIAFVYRYTATHTGDWMGMAATGVRLDVTGCSVLKVRDGHFAEVRMFQPDVIAQLRRAANIQLVERFTAADIAHDLDAYLSCVAPNLEVWGNGKLLRSGREAQALHIQGNWTALPDTQEEILSTLAEGDTVVTRWRRAGTQTGPYGPLPATGKRLELFGTSTYEIRDGLIQFYRLDVDTAPISQLAST